MSSFAFEKTDDTKILANPNVDEIPAVGSHCS
jgi:hypothetical protein